KIGTVTSGTMSIFLNKPIGMGYVAHGYEDVGTKISIKIRDKLAGGTVISLPFYSRTR
ncbi:glycine cleavage system aminomethyltransferase GcvT, partial [bacterium]|nr:glycine cleavage system aminomethyltransferase GcvT [candidate division CSSED10-310 bacterium]